MLVIRQKKTLLLSEIPSALSLNDENFSIDCSSSFAGDLHMPDTRDCFVPLQHALNILIKDYDAFLLTIEINTVAIIMDNKGHYRIFDSHSQDILMVTLLLMEQQYCWNSLV